MAFYQRAIVNEHPEEALFPGNDVNTIAELHGPLSNLWPFWGPSDDVLPSIVNFSTILHHTRPTFINAWGSSVSLDPVKPLLLKIG